MSSPAKKQKYSYNKQKKHFKPSKRQFLEPGMRGFLATCNFREKDCVRECYNILNQTADELYGKPETAIKPNGGAAADTDDITDELQKEIEAANATKQAKGKDALKRFQAVDTGTTNCVFISTTLPDPVELGVKIVSEIARTREQKSRFLLRLIPVEAVCRANLSDITAAGGLIFDKHFLKQACTFSIIFNKRYNNDMKRDDVIPQLAALVQSKNVGNRVDLKQAEKTVLVEVIKGLCCIAVLDNYLKYKKYNLVELANVKEEKPEKQADADEKKETANLEGNDAEETEQSHEKEEKKVVNEMADDKNEQDEIEEQNDTA